MPATPWLSFIDGDPGVRQARRLAASDAAVAAVRGVLPNPSTVVGRSLPELEKEADLPKVVQAPRVRRPVRKAVERALAPASREPVDAYRPAPAPSDPQAVDKRVSAPEADLLPVAAKPVAPVAWEVWLQGLDRQMPVALSTPDRLWSGVSPGDRSLLLENVRARLRSMGRPDPWVDHLNADPPHLYAPKIVRGAVAMKPAWLNIATGTTGSYPIEKRVVAGMKAEVILIDGIIAACGHAIHRNEWALDYVVPESVDRSSVFPASLYASWLAPEPWQSADKVENRRFPRARFSIDLLATPAEVVVATVRPENRGLDDLRAAARSCGHAGTAGAEGRALAGLPQFHRSLVERKAQLLYLLRAVVDGQAYDDPALWVDRPWIAEFAEVGLFADEVGQRARSAPPASAPVPAKDLVVDLVCRLLEPGGVDLVDRYEEAFARFSRLSAGGGPPRGAPYDEGGIDDLPTRVQVVGRAVRPQDASLSEAERRAMFDGRPVVAGSAADPSFILPVGVVVVMPDDGPAFIRGRGWSTTSTGRLLVEGPLSDHPNRTMPFHLPDRLRARALDHETPEPGFGPGPKAIYYRGYRWNMRSGGGLRRWDETEPEAAERAGRALAAVVEATEAARFGTASYNPFRTEGFADMWPFGPGSDGGPGPDDIRRLFAALGGPFDPEAFGPIESWRRSSAASAPMAAPASWDRSWENAAAFEARWGAASLPANVVAAVGRHGLIDAAPGRGDSRDLPRIVADAKAAIVDATVAEIARSLEPAYARLHSAAVAAARERAAFIKQLDDDAVQRDVERRRGQVGRRHRDEGREAAIVANATDAERRRCSGWRLAYIPDPEVDGAACRVEIVPYDASFRPEASMDRPAETKLAERPFVDHSGYPALDPSFDTDGRLPYRSSEIERHVKAASGSGG